MASETHPVSNLNPIELGAEELTLIRCLLPSLENGNTYHTGAVVEGSRDYQRIANQTLISNANGNLFYIPIELRELLGCNSRGYRADDLTNRRDDSPDNGPHIEPTTSEEELEEPKKELPILDNPKGNNPVRVSTEAGRSEGPAITSSFHVSPGDKIIYASGPRGPLSSQDRRTARPIQPSAIKVKFEERSPPKKGLEPSPSFLDRISAQSSTSVRSVSGITAKELADFRAYQKALSDPDFLASKVRGMNLVTSTTDPKDSATQGGVSSTTPFRRAVTVAPVAEVIVVEDDEVEIGLEKEKDPNVIVKSLVKANIKKYTGTQDAESYWSRFETDTDMRFCHPGIRLRVAFLYVHGAALTTLSAAVRAKTEPKTFRQLVAFFMNHFPSTLSIQSIDKRFDNLRQNEGETVLSYWTRHQQLTKDADEVGYKYDPITAFTKRSIKNKVSNRAQSPFCKTLRNL